MMRRVLISCFLTALILGMSVLPALASEPVATTTESDDATPTAVPVGTAEDGRSLYSVSDPPSFPVFNSVIDGEFGDEQYFVTITPKTDSASSAATATIQLQPDSVYDVKVHYVNDCAPQAIRSYAYANDTKVRVALPAVVGDTANLVATISASDTTPKSVSGQVALQSTTPLSLEYVDGTARIRNNNKTDGTSLPATELFGQGTPIGTQSLIGIVLNGPENAGYIEFEFRTTPISATALESTAAEAENPTSQSETEPTTPSAEEDQFDRNAIIVAAIACGLVIVFAVVKTLREERQQNSFGRR